MLPECRKSLETPDLDDTNTEPRWNDIERGKPKNFEKNISQYNLHRRRRHHHMALQPNSGPGLPLWGFVTITFLQGWIVSPVPNPQTGGPGLRIYDPRWPQIQPP
jgi:hypothetical protein